MPIDPAHLARSLGALDTLDVEGGFTGTLQQVLGSARTLLDADMAGLMLVDHAGTLRWASCSNPMVQTHEGELEQLAHGPCRVAFAQRAPAAVLAISAESSWPALARMPLIERGMPRVMNDIVTTGLEFRTDSRDGRRVAGDFCEAHGLDARQYAHDALALGIRTWQVASRVRDEQYAEFALLSARGVEACRHQVGGGVTP